MKTRTWCKFPLVEVTWHDAAGETGWETLYDAQQADIIECMTTGYLIKKDRRRVVIAGSLRADTTRVEHTTTIPRSWVAKITLLSEVQSEDLRTPDFVFTSPGTTTPEPR